MIFALKKTDFFICNEINKPVFLCYASRPDTSSNMFERFGFPQSFKWYFDSVLDQFEYLKRNSAIVFYPFGKFFSELRVECTLLLSVTQARFPFSNLREIEQVSNPSLHLKEPVLVWQHF